jgi:hypothetical protein
LEGGAKHIPHPTHCCNRTPFYTSHSVIHNIASPLTNPLLLLLPPQDAFSYGFGVRVGVALVLLAWVLWDTFVDDSLGQDVWHDPAFKVPRLSLYKSVATSQDLSVYAPRDTSDPC